MGRNTAKPLIFSGLNLKQERENVIMLLYKKNNPLTSE